MTNSSLSPGSVAQVLPATSRSVVTPSIPSSSDASQSRARIQVSVQATRCAPVLVAGELAQLLEAGDRAGRVDLRHQRTAGPGAGRAKVRRMNWPEPGCASTSPSAKASSPRRNTLAGAPVNVIPS